MTYLLRVHFSKNSRVFLCVSSLSVSYLIITTFSPYGKFQENKVYSFDSFYTNIGGVDGGGGHFTKISLNKTEKTFSLQGCAQIDSICSISQKSAATTFLQDFGRFCKILQDIACGSRLTYSHFNIKFIEHIISVSLT